jgi:hypothetical protein
LNDTGWSGAQPGSSASGAVNETSRTVPIAECLIRTLARRNYCNYDNL